MDSGDGISDESGHRGAPSIADTIQLKAQITAQKELIVHLNNTILQQSRNLTAVEDQLKAYPTFAELNAALAFKADQSELSLSLRDLMQTIEQELSLKAEEGTMKDILRKKVDISRFQEQERRLGRLRGLLDSSAAAITSDCWSKVQSALEHKADMKAVDLGLRTKADQLQLTQLAARVASLEASAEESGPVVAHITEQMSVQKNELTNLTDELIMLRSDQEQIGEGLHHTTVHADALSRNIGGHHSVIEQERSKVQALASQHQHTKALLEAVAVEGSDLNVWLQQQQQQVQQQYQQQHALDQRRILANEDRLEALQHELFVLRRRVRATAMAENIRVPTPSRGASPALTGARPPPPADPAASYVTAASNAPAAAALNDAAGYMVEDGGRRPLTPRARTASTGLLLPPPYRPQSATSGGATAMSGYASSSGNIGSNGNNRGNGRRSLMGGGGGWDSKNGATMRRPTQQKPQHRYLGPPSPSPPPQHQRSSAHPPATAATAAAARRGRAGTAPLSRRPGQARSQAAGGGGVRRVRAISNASSGGARVVVRAGGMPPRPSQPPTDTVLLKGMSGEVEPDNDVTDTPATSGGAGEEAAEAERSSSVPAEDRGVAGTSMDPEYSSELGKEGQKHQWKRLVGAGGVDNKRAGQVAPPPSLLKLGEGLGCFDQDTSTPNSTVEQHRPENQHELEGGAGEDGGGALLEGGMHEKGSTAGSMQRGGGAVTVAALLQAQQQQESTMQQGGTTRETE